MAQTKLTLFYTSFIEGHKFVQKLLAMITMPNKDLDNGCKIQKEKQIKQECIPVGCVPSDSYLPVLELEFRNCF